MSKFYLLLVFLCLGVEGNLNAETEYNVDLSSAKNNLYKVSVTFTPSHSDSTILKMATWTPGSYLIREFSKHIGAYSTIDNKGNQLKSGKLNKNTWYVLNNKSEKITFSYEFYAHELSVRTSYICSDFALINGAGLFIYPESESENGYSLNFSMPQSWIVSTSLKNTGNEIYFAEDLDELFDSPILLGDQKVHTFQAAGVKHKIAILGTDLYEIEGIKKDLSKIAEYQTSIFDHNPNKEYLYIVIARSNGDSGLEHKSSTTLIIDRHSLALESSYKRFLGLCAHEYFHLWNVKRLRAKNLGPFDYENENYTRLLWLMEGFTSYYGSKTLYNIDLHSEERFLRNVFYHMERHYNRPGYEVQSLAEASLDAWIKYYRSDENDYNATVSYYSGGKIMAAILDLKIINDTNGEKSLDDLMKNMYQEYFLNTDRGFDIDDLLNSLQKLTGRDYQEFIEKYILNPGFLPIEDFVSIIGFEIKTNKASYQFGFSFDSENEHYVVRTVKKDSDAFKAGLNVEDEILAIENERFNSENMNFFKSLKNEGDIIELIVLRDDQIRIIKMKKSNSGSDEVQISKKKNQSDVEKKMYSKFVSKH